MGSPISPIVANLYMEDFEIKAISSAEYPPRIWKRYVDVHFCGHRLLQERRNFWSTLTTWTIHPVYTEDVNPDGCLLPWTTIVMPQPDNSLLTSVCRKPTCTDLYLQVDSYHHLSARYSVINPLKHSARAFCSNKQLLKEEEDHLKKLLAIAST